MRLLTRRPKWVESFRWYIPVVVLLPALFYLPGIFGKIPFSSELVQYSDLMITHYPYAVVLRKALFDHNVIPFWSSLIYSGMPFSSNPLSGLFYLPGWISLIFPLPAGISITVALHVVMGTWGFFKFLKSERLSVETDGFTRL